MRLSHRVLLRAMLFLVLPATVLGSMGTSGAQPTGDDGPVYVVDISGTIDLGLAPYVDRVVGEAEDNGAAAVIFEIDTPGGRLDAVIQMRDTIIDADVPTIALIDATAYSAGALVAIASDEIYMTPGAVVGAATPVQGGTGEVADEKTISAVRAAFEAAAEVNGRDPEVAAAMVDTRVSIEGLVGDDELLTLTASEAIEFAYAEGTVADLEALLAERGLDDNERVDPGLSVAERVVRFLTDPVIAGLLLTAGLLLIVSDLFSGGVGVAALGGLGLLGVFFWGHLLAGLAGWEDLVLLVVGIGLIAVEVFVLPGFGVAGVLGLGALAAGAFLAMIYRDFDFVTNDDLWRAGVTVALTLVGVVLGMILLIVLVSRRGAGSGLVLANRLGSGGTVSERSSSGWLRWFDGHNRLEPDRVERPEGPADNAAASLVGSTGVALTDLRPGGMVEIDGQRVDAVTSGEFLPAGEGVEVVRDDRYRRVVRKRS